MKKTYFFLLLLALPFVTKAQCFVQVQVQNVSCFNLCNGAATAFPTGQAPYNYLWLPGNMTTQMVSGLCPGTYTVNVIDANNCVATATFNIIQPTQLGVNITNVIQASCSSCCDGTATASGTGGTPPYAYTWTPGNVTSSVYQGMCAGTYTCCVTDAMGCVSCTTVTITFSTDVQEQSAIGNLSVFPSPATQFVTVKESFANSVSAVISITNVLGETVYTKSVAGTSELNENINVAEFNSGVYFISVKTASGTTVRRFVKE